MSERENIAYQIADKCKEFGLNEVYGVDVGKSTENGKPHYLVTFCRARLIDGVVKVYSPKFILVKWQTQFRDMEARGQQKFDSAEAAINFIQTYFERTKKVA